ncbi:hypothetical protein [Sandaracinus amylolyticus]|uniref:hypothetical protein n=1 Tax=Sandaracinus amylolyticus TaxID=927083 RepID=UPI00069EEEA7|nr:hypothetical protein [Sandaracinus amylolyticus]
MLPLYVVLAGTIAGVSMVIWSIRRARQPTLREGATRTSIAELAPGRFRVIGRVIPIRTTPSEIDGAACVYVERARYAAVGGGLVPLMREVDHGWSAHRFFLDDGSARLLVDPAEVLIDCSTATGDGGLVAERRLRAGEEIELVARFRAADGASTPDLDEGPYRAAASSWEAVADDVGPPRISYRTEEGMERASLDEISSFLRGAGALMIATSLLFGGVMLWLHWWLAIPV